MLTSSRTARGWAELTYRQMTCGGGRMVETIWFGGAEWQAVLRIGLGVWWLESWRRKDKKAWAEGVPVFRVVDGGGVRGEG